MDNGILYTTPTGSNDDWYLPLNHHIHFYVILIFSQFSTACVYCPYITFFFINEGLYNSSIGCMLL